jgi:hypothetical protein
MERMHSDRNAWTFLASTDTKVELKIVMQQPHIPPFMQWCRVTFNVQKKSTYGYTGVIDDGNIPRYSWWC